MAVGRRQSVRTTLYHFQRMDTDIATRGEDSTELNERMRRRMRELGAPAVASGHAAMPVSASSVLACLARDASGINRVAEVAASLASGTSLHRRLKELAGPIRGVPAVHGHVRSLGLQAHDVQRKSLLAGIEQTQLGFASEASRVSRRLRFTGDVKAGIIGSVGARPHLGAVGLASEVSRLGFLGPASDLLAGFPPHEGLGVEMTRQLRQGLLTQGVGAIGVRGLNTNRLGFMADANRVRSTFRTPGFATELSHALRGVPPLTRLGATLVGELSGRRLGIAGVDTLGAARVASSPYLAAVGHVAGVESRRLARLAPELARTAQARAVLADVDAGRRSRQLERIVEASWAPPEALAFRLAEEIADGPPPFQDPFADDEREGVLDAVVEVGGDLLAQVAAAGTAGARWTWQTPLWWAPALRELWPELSAAERIDVRHKAVTAAGTLMAVTYLAFTGRMAELVIALIAAIGAVGEFYALVQRLSA